MGERKKRPHLKLDPDLSRSSLWKLIHNTLPCKIIFCAQTVLKTALNSCFNLQFCYWPLLIKNGLHLYFLKECEVTLTWLLVGRLTHSTSSKPTAWIKKPPRVKKNPGTKRGGPGEDGGLYMRRLYKCVDTICQHQLHCPIFHLRKHQNLNYFY